MHDIYGLGFLLQQTGGFTIVVRNLHIDIKNAIFIEMINIDFSKKFIDTSEPIMNYNNTTGTARRLSDTNLCDKIVLQMEE